VFWSMLFLEGIGTKVAHDVHGGRCFLSDELQAGSSEYVGSEPGTGESGTAGSRKR
jgi:hypothetical protein